MRTRKLLYVVLPVLVCAIIGLYFFFNSEESHRAAAKLAGVKAAIGSDEDPEARANYEITRLKDPATGKIPPDIRRKELEFAAALPTRESLAAFSKDGGPNEIALINWSPRGPVNVGGRTRALALDVTNENIIIAGGVSGGMWRSTNGGTSWIKTTSPAQLHSVTAVAQDTRAGKTATWYYATGEYRGNSAFGGGNSFYSGDGIFKSTDGGVSWNLLPATSTGVPQAFDNFFDYVWNIAVDPSNTSQDEVYAATYSAIYRSTNGGANWNPVLGGSSPYSPYVDLAVTSTGVVYATMSSGGSASGIWRSTDGISWSNITPGGFPSTYTRIVIGFAPSNENVVYFLADTPGSGLNGHSFWKYTHNTTSWANRSANLPAYGPPVGNYDSQGSYDMLVKVKPDNENVVFIGGTNLYRSTDGFASSGNTAWIGGYATANNVTQYPYHHPDQHSLVFLPSNSAAMLSGHDGGISKTTNNLATPVAWDSLSHGYFTTQFYTIAIDHATGGSDRVMGGMQDNGTWQTTASSVSTPWSEIFGGDGAYCAYSNGASLLYISAQNGLIYRFNSALTQWTRVDPTGGTGYLFINPFVLDPNNTNVMYLAGGDRIWRNSDLTAIPLFSPNTTSVNWTNLANTVVAGQAVTALEISTTPANRLYYGTNTGNLYRLDNANNPASVPTNVTGGTFPAGAFISCIAINPANADQVMAVFSNYSVLSLFYSSNGGSSWTNVSGNLEQNPNGSGNGPSTRWASILNAGGTTYYFVASSTGLYSTTTLNGASTVWAQEAATMIGNVVVDMVKSRQADGLVVVGTHGIGVYSGDVITGIEPLAGQIPAAFTLKQNYPNPFNPSTNIEYAITKKSPVRLTVYNIQGQTVAELVNEVQSPGSYNIKWNGKDRYGKEAASGVYVYRLATDDFAASGKMMLVR